MNPVQLLDLRRLRFDHEMRDDESIVGAVASATRAHVLGSTTVAFKEAGVGVICRGTVQMASHEDLTRLAYVIRCTPEAMIANAGVRVGSAKAQPNHQSVRFGDLDLPRSHLEMHVRRVSPASLTKADYHRLGWLNLLLPYCPESLEELVSTCSECRATLGWKGAWGLGVCEYCLTPLAPSARPNLPADLVESYRFFADLISPAASLRSEARGGLSERLAGERLATLHRLTLLIGGICRDAPIRTTSRFGVLRLPAADQASVVATGAGFLRDWPHGIRRWLEQRVEEIRDDRGRYEDLLGRLRRAVTPGDESGEQIALLNDALPDLTKHHTHRFSGTGRYYMRNDVTRLLALPTRKLRTFDVWKDLRARALPSKGQRLLQYDADQIDSLAPKFRGCMPLNGCSRFLGVPNYGIEQLCCLGLIELEDNPAVTATRNWVPVRRASLDALRLRLLDARSTVRRPGGVLTLRRASRRLGGGPKPWGALFAALLHETEPLQFWLSGQDAGARSIMVRAEDLVRFQVVEFEKACFPTFPFDAGISQIDAGEMLNTIPCRVQPAAQALGLTFKPDGDASLANLESTLAIARALAFSGEVALHMRVPEKAVAALLRKLQIPSVALGWPRAVLIDHGILPSLPR
jgi:hypothetical protein